MGDGMGVYADTWELIEMTGINNKDKKKWRFGDHCIVEFASSAGRIMYDPSFQRSAPVETWFEYLDSVLGKQEEMSVQTPQSVINGDPWNRGRGSYLPTTVTWKTRAKEGPKRFYIQEGETDFRDGFLSP
jgi:hypothetical protein